MKPTRQVTADASPKLGHKLYPCFCATAENGVTGYRFVKLVKSGVRIAGAGTLGLREQAEGRPSRQGHNAG